MDVIRVGSEILLKRNIPATVTAINIRGSRHVTYECQWWKDGVCYTQWFEPFMIAKTDNTVIDTIGFK